MRREDEGCRRTAARDLLLIAALAILVPILAPSSALALCEAGFRRGDSNGDGRHDISDGVATLQFLFLGTRELDCHEAADADDSGKLELTDAVFSFSFLFSGTEPPPYPGPDACGADPSIDDLTCVAYAACADGEMVVCDEEGCCPEGSYCERPAGECSAAGVCRPRPLGCPDVWDPVCGCDGRTYSNSCDAAAAGVSIAFAGECEKGCAADGDCGPDAYCSRPAGECDAVSGVCEERPRACPAVYDPVCGCDGRTYGNSCEAASAGMNVAYEGECEPLCSTNDDCERDDYCAKATGDCDGAGECEPRPGACPRVFDPVCGCDGATYSNACVAASAGVSVLHEGECEAR